MSTGKSTIHSAAAKGFQVGADAYERGRPEYPADAVRNLVVELGLAAGTRVLDLGAGTGKFTKLLSSCTKATITGMDPVEGMRKKFSALFPEIEILAGSAENTLRPDASLMP